ncbi:uncharacterized protein LOC127287603 [Leptopilina boulardi]|uniref:uncharacterized protein LOC127287603 n=1 Tax=Leptopilina boulardi TaxID=63433 RepID=UPI0021F5B739|nr:uncharacterized protein LOC127287603 [Leptopilina boulardi]XP_051170571.1 uncharacterized protein LOC127287603 [Leptopilina boulardi]
MDLNRYKLNIPIQPAKVTSVQEYNKLIKLVKILEQEMNFEPIIIPCPNMIDIRSTNIHDIALGYELNRKQQVTVDADIIFSGQKNCMYIKWFNGENMQILEFISAKVIIPRNAKVANKIQLSSEFWNMILTTIGIVAVIRITAYLFKFNWQTLNISQIIIGMGTGNEPQNWSERIIFGSLLIACLAYTSYFFTIILDISFRTANEISTIDELLKLYLPTVISYDAYGTLASFENSSVLQFLNKEYRYINHELRVEAKCLKYLADHQNITCIIHEAIKHINTYESKYGKTNKFKVLKDDLKYGTNSFEVKEYSPFIERFNEIILRASEFGLIKDFYEPIVRPLIDNLEPELITKEKLLPILFGVLITGYSLSIIVFLLEIITDKIRRKFFDKPRFRFIL